MAFRSKAYYPDLVLAVVYCLKQFIKHHLPRAASKVLTSFKKESQGIDTGAF